jgi:Chalcone isomerase-like
MLKPFLLATLLAFTLSSRAQTPPVDVAGVKYETTAEVAGQKLQLNGAGIRYKAIFKVYTAGLYLGSKAGTPEAVMSAPGAKRLHIQMLRDIDGNELGKLFTKGMEQNASREEFAKAINGVLRMADIFASKKKLTTGENFGVDWVPGTGTVVYVNGKATGEPIKEAEFYNVLLKIWLGKSPADDQLKDALLGIQPRSSGRATN